MSDSRRAGLLLVMMEVDPAAEDEFNRWYDEEHYPQRMGCPGFLRGRRFRAVDGEPKYLAFFELEGPDVLESEPYKAMSAPSQWTEQVWPSITRVVRNVYEDITPEPAGGVPGRTVDFASQSLEPEAPGIASRAVEVNGVRWALVEYEPGVLREEWCTEGHSGYVLDGEVTYEFAGGGEPLHVAAGDGFTLADGSAHRGRAGDAGARLFLIDRAG